MARRTLQELIAAQQGGTIGRRGLQRLAEMSQTHAASGVDLGLQSDPQADLNARRAALYSHALEAAHNLQPGQTLAAGFQRRLQLGAGGPMSRDTFTPTTAAGAQAFQGDNYTTMLDALKKRAQGIRSQAGIYR